METQPANVTAINFPAKPRSLLLISQPARSHPLILQPANIESPVPQLAAIYTATNITAINIVAAEQPMITANKITAISHQYHSHQDQAIITVNKVTASIPPTAINITRSQPTRSQPPSQPSISEPSMSQAIEITTMYHQYHSQLHSQSPSQPSISQPNNLQLATITAINITASKTTASNFTAGHHRSHQFTATITAINITFTNHTILNTSFNQNQQLQPGAVLFYNARLFFDHNSGLACFRVRPPFQIHLSSHRQLFHRAFLFQDFLVQVVDRAKHHLLQSLS